MAKKKKVIPSEFEDILGGIYGNSEDFPTVTNVDDLLPESQPLEEENEDEPPVNTEDGEKKDDTPKSDDFDDDSEIPDDVLKNQTTLQDSLNTNEENSDEEITDDDVAEAQQVGLLFDAVAQSLGWDINNIDDKDRPLTVDDLTTYLTKVVEQNSVPTYADERIQKLDEYVKNGGKFEDFYARQQESISLDNLDLEDESNQKAVIRELLKYDNYTDDQINKKLERYEDNDLLYEESEEALSRLKQIRKLEVEQAEREQQIFLAQQQEQQKKFFDSVTNEINSLTNIRGIQIPKEDRKALFDYIFKVDGQGLSQYQRDFQENLTKNLIESAYFTMKADTLISTAKKDGESSAADKLRKLMRHSSKNHTTYNVEEKQRSVTDLLAGQF